MNWKYERIFGKNLPVNLSGSTMLLSLFLPIAAWAGLTDSLDEKQLGALQRGEQVTINENVEGMPWPRISVYRMVNASPEEAMAVFFDYNRACDFIPNVKKSEISKRINAASQEVLYSVDVPILPDEVYTMRNSLVGTAKGYRIGWTLVEATTMKAADGSFESEPLGGQCLVRYQNLVDPGSKLAGALRGFASQQIQKTVVAIAEEIESQKQKSPNELKRKVDLFQEAVGK